MTEEKKETTGDKSLQGAFEEFSFVEKCGGKSRCVQFRIFERMSRIYVLVENADGQNGLGCVENVVDGDEHRLKKGLQSEW